MPFYGLFQKFIPVLIYCIVLMGLHIFLASHNARSSEVKKLSHVTLQLCKERRTQ